jgi:indole-3-glycerol phosphate synthase
MPTILDKIIDEKKKEIIQLQESGFSSLNRSFTPEKGLFETVKSSEHLRVIAEIKRASPSKGDIKTEVIPAEQAKLYEKHGACAISVLTDTPFFKGTMEDLASVRESVSIPILCKDFIIDEIQIERAKDAGANVVLLIAAALDEGRLRELYKKAIELGLEVLLEVHDEEEMKLALSIGAKIIGINNRNLKTFEVDLGTTEKLAALAREHDVVIISESGFQSRKNAERAAATGAGAILVGETLMRSENLSKTFQSFHVKKGE